MKRALDLSNSFNLSDIKIGHYWGMNEGVLKTLLQLRCKRNSIRIFMEVEGNAPNASGTESGILKSKSIQSLVRG